MVRGAISREVRTAGRLERECEPGNSTSIARLAWGLPGRLPIPLHYLIYNFQCLYPTDDLFCKNRSK